ncbi:MAG TPA: DNA-directed RNA polymerase subunit alpha C-terminal domain-containing protein [Candidatus Paceibacterota bacterium]|nr:DNA-directed RNA polymerase subunit alpha C-terminal domain-containing protein [Candidatus Paceibacterota bacterium]
MKKIIYIHFDELRKYLIEKGKIPEEETVSNIKASSSGKSIAIECSSVSIEHKNFLSMGIEDLDISPSLMKIFLKMEIKNGGDILKRRMESDWRKIRNVGNKKIQEINALLKAYNLPILEKEF